MSSYGPPMGGAPPPKSPPPGNAPGRDLDPVDLSTGLFVLTKTDLIIPDVVPVVLERTYRPGDPVSRPFGVGMRHPYAMFLWTPTTACPYLALILPDGGRIQFNRLSAGTTCQSTTFTHSSTPTAFAGASISCAVFDCTLRRPDGTEYGFDMHLATSGRMTRIRDRFGNTLTFTYSGQVLTRLTTPHGRRLDLSYDAQNRIIEASDGPERVVRYEYDGAGRIWRAG
jgi:YD repeat-containing protein